MEDGSITFAETPTGSRVPAFFNQRYGEVSLLDNMLTVASQSLKLTRRERIIMKHLLDDPTQPCHRQQILTELGYVHTAQTHTLETHINRLRTKLRSSGISDLIMNKVRHGYYLSQQ